MAKMSRPDATTERDRVPAEVKKAYEQFQKERRATPRVPVRLSVRFESGPAFTKAYGAYTSNIGVGGLCLLTANTYDVGAPLRLTIEIAPDRTLLVDGHVAWVRAGVAIGVRFEPLSKDVETAIGDIVRKALSGPPAP